ncbi:hypothetical protein Tco_0842462 [Tanacetum coccineum]|uniref:Late embryogenesis abundant protein LEA-2 subgroup domain-containing protein n=1 Tax=Tanacetum coccineum TaxID=301880 RepID=A0ABQ5AZC2_9ASTR
MHRPSPEMERANIQMIGHAAVLLLNEAKFENIVRAEDMRRTYNCLGRTVTKSCKICMIMIGMAAFIFLLFFILANYAWDWGRLHIENVGIRFVYADINITSPGLLTIRAHGSLLPTFRASGDINHPVLGDLTMGIRGKRYRNIKILCKSTFQTFGNEELGMVTCEPTQIRLKEEDMMMLKKLISKKELRIQVFGSFKWHLVNKNPLIWKQTNEGARFGCTMLYHHLLRGECYPF